jgi:hypothetical protein
MTTQAFKLYTANGYAGDLVDSGPRVIQTGILTSAEAGFGVAMKRDTSVSKGVALGGEASVYAIAQREYNHEASTRPSPGNDTVYKQTESVSLIRQGYLYALLSGAVAVTEGELLHVDTATGLFSKDTTSATVVVTTNVVADESALVGEVFKIRIDIK